MARKGLVVEISSDGLLYMYFKITGTFTFGKIELHEELPRLKI